MPQLLKLRFLPLLLAAALASCGAPQSASLGNRPGEHAGTHFAGLFAWRIDGVPLDARALAAEASLLFPEEIRAVGQSLMRSELARLDAQALHLVPPVGAVDEAVRLALREVELGLEEGDSLEEWARNRFGRSLEEFGAALRHRLAANLRFQMVVRTRLWTAPRHRVFLVACEDLESARDRASAWRAGADPRQTPGCRDLELATSTIQDWTGEDPVVGQVPVPFPLPDDCSWYVLLVREELPSSGIPPAKILIESIRQVPLDPLQERAWWDGALNRYTAVVTSPAIRAGIRSFVPR